VEAEAEGDAAAEEAERVHKPLAPAPKRRGFQLLVRLAGGDDRGQADGREQQEAHRDQAEWRDKYGAQGDLERLGGVWLEGARFESCARHVPPKKTQRFRSGFGVFDFLSVWVSIWESFANF